MLFDFTNGSLKIVNVKFESQFCTDPGFMCVEYRKIVSNYGRCCTKSRDF